MLHQNFLVTGDTLFLLICARMEVRAAGSKREIVQSGPSEYEGD